MAAVLSCKVLVGAEGAEGLKQRGMWKPARTGQGRVQQLRLSGVWLAKPNTRLKAPIPVVSAAAGRTNSEYNCYETEVIRKRVGQEEEKHVIILVFATLTCDDL